MNKYVAFGKKLLGLAVIITLMAGCAFFKNVFAPKEMESPSVKLIRVEVARELGWWFYAENITPTQGDEGNHGALLTLAFIFTIKNPNTYPVMMDRFNFSVKYDKAILDEIKLTEVTWIPSGKVNELRVYSFLDPQSVRLNLLVEQGETFKEKNITLWSYIKKYWTEIPKFKNPISAFDGKAGFKAKNRTKIVDFRDEYIKKSSEKKKDNSAASGNENQTAAEEKTN